MIFLLGLLLVFVAEAFFTTIPLVYVFLLGFFIKTKSAFLFLLAFLLGFILDALSLRPYGETSMVYMSIFFLVLLYERKYEVRTVQFVFISSFLGVLLLLFLYGHSSIFFQSIIAALIGVLLFL